MQDRGLPDQRSRVVDPGAARGVSGVKPQVTPKLVTDRGYRISPMTTLTCIRQVGEDLVRIELGA